MDKVISAVVAIVALLFFLSLLSGTVVWLVWPVAIPAAFPGLVASGAVPAALGWWPSVCLTWIAGALVKSSNYNDKK